MMVDGAAKKKSSTLEALWEWQESQQLDQRRSLRMSRIKINTRNRYVLFLSIFKYGAI